MRKIRQGVALVSYRWVAMRLPASSNRPIGRSARRLRATTARPLLLSCGDYVNIESGAMFPVGSVRLGDRSGIGIRAHLKGPVTIGCDVMMGPEVVIFTTDHNFADVSKPMMDQGMAAPRPVTIGDDVWIGQRAMILPGLNIGSHSVIAAGSVVTKDVPEYSVIGGNPARVLRSRAD